MFDVGDVVGKDGLGVLAADDVKASAMAHKNDPKTVAIDRWTSVFSLLL